jgi:hypothetical protein
MRIINIIVCFFLLGAESLFSQCPDRDSLWKQIFMIRNSSVLNKTEQLTRLTKLDQQVKDCPMRMDSTYTYLQLSIGVVFYRLADYTHAIQVTKKALNIIQKNRESPWINKTDLFKYYYYLSIYYDSIKLESQKNEAIDSCISNEMEANTDYHFTSLVLQDNVIDLYNKGDFNRCIERSSLGEALIHKYYRYFDSLNHTIFFITYKANALRSLGRFTEEEQFLRSKSKEFAKINNTIYKGDFYSLFGYLSISKNQYKNAIDYFKKAYYYNTLSVNKELGATVLNRIGMIYYENLHQNGPALQYYYKALKHSNNKVLANANASDSFYILGNIANVYAGMKLFDSAYYFFQRAFDKIKPGIDENDLAVHIEDYVIDNNAEHVVKLVLDKADAHLQEYDNKMNNGALSKALNIYKSADRLLNAIKVEQTELESKLFWRSYAQHLYEHAIRAAYLENNQDDAFYFFEKSRAVLLSDQLNEQNNIPESEILKQADLKRKILLLKREQIMGTSSNEYIEIQKSLLTYEQELERLSKSIKKHSYLYSFGDLDTTFITLKCVKNNLLKDHQALLELFEGDSAVYEMQVTTGNNYFSKINRTDFDTCVNKYINFISSPILLNSRFTEYTKIAHHLYDLIFKTHPPPAGRIIVSPDRGYFPFETLVSNANYEFPVYFLQNHAVSYTYSARYLINEMNVNPSKKTANFLGVAPVRFPTPFRLVELRGSDLSLNQIGSYFQCAHNLTGDQATKNNFLNEFSKYTIIQLYTHSTDSSNNGEPIIYFADSILYLSDLISGNKPITRLVVLSACETGNGKLYQGEGVFSFNRGFASLGIPSAIINLWSVDNKSTYRLTELFYQFLLQGQPDDIALQNSKIQFLKDGSKEKQLPYFWAAAIIVGKTDVLVPHQGKTWIREVFTLLTLIIVFFFAWRMRNSILTRILRINKAA